MSVLLITTHLLFNTCYNTPGKREKLHMPMTEKQQESQYSRSYVLYYMVHDVFGVIKYKKRLKGEIRKTTSKDFRVIVQFSAKTPQIQCC